MKIIIKENKNEVANYVALLIKELINKKPDAVLGLATGSTPIPTYQKLIDFYNNKEIDFSKVKSINLDEYVGIPITNNQSYDFFMKKNLFNKINIKPENTYLPKGYGDMETNLKEFKDKINHLNPVDLQLLGIGLNGHIGFNEPPAYINLKSRIVDLDPITIKSNSRFFKNINDVPTKAITMGIYEIFSAKLIVLIATGEEKAQIINDIINKEIQKNNPASFLKLHNNTIIVLDKKAAKLL